MFKEYAEYIENRFDRKIRVLWNDNRVEYLTKGFSRYTAQNDICVQKNDYV